MFFSTERSIIFSFLYKQNKFIFVFEGIFKNFTFLSYVSEDYARFTVKIRFYVLLLFICFQNARFHEAVRTFIFWGQYRAAGVHWENNLELLARKGSSGRAKG